MMGYHKLVVNAILGALSCASNIVFAQNPLVLGNKCITVITPTLFRLDYAQNQKFLDLPTMFTCERGNKLEKGVTVTTLDGDVNTFTLYEDDGVSRDYEKGEYAKTTLTYTQNGKRAVLLLIQRKEVTRDRYLNILNDLRSTVLDQNTAISISHHVQSARV